MSAKTEAFLAEWHDIVKSRNPSKLDEILDDQAVMLSPVVHTPQVGKQITKMYLTAALGVFANDSFKYVRELTSEDSLVLEFETEINGIFINGIDMIKLNDEGKVIEFKVMVRPLKALNLIHEMMGKMLASFSKS